MTAYTEALRQAKYFHEHRESLTKQDRYDAAAALAEWGVFSNKHIAAILDMRPADVNGITKKSDPTGGRFAPAAIDAILHVIALRQRGEIDVFAVRRAVKEGCGVRMLSRLTGQSESTLKRHDARALRLEEAA